jgi:hypothetical protein
MSSFKVLMHRHSSWLQFRYFRRVFRLRAHQNRHQSPLSCAVVLRVVLQVLDQRCRCEGWSRQMDHDPLHIYGFIRLF